MWKPFFNSARRHIPPAAILYDQFPIMQHLGQALDQVRQREYARLTGPARGFIKGQKYTLLSHRENLTREGRRGLKKLLAVNRRLQVAYLLQESFGSFWSDERAGWARRCFENWQSALPMATAPTR